MSATRLETPASVHLPTLCWVVGGSFTHLCCDFSSWNSSSACQQVRMFWRLPHLRLTSQALSLEQQWLWSGVASRSSSGGGQRMISSWPIVLMSHPSATQSRMQSVSRTLNGWSSLGSALTWAASRFPTQETLAAGSAHATALTMTSLVGSARAQHPSTWKCRHTASWKRTNFSSAEISVSAVPMVLSFCVWSATLPFILPGLGYTFDGLLSECSVVASTWQ